MRPFYNLFLLLSLASLGIAAASCAASSTPSGATGTGGGPAGAGGADAGGASGSGSGSGGLGLAGMSAGGSGANGSTCSNLRVDGKDVCPGSLADKAFRAAVCACNAGAVLVNTDSYDSVSDPTTLLWGAPVGINGFAIFGLNEPTDIGGSLIVTEDINVWSMNVHGDMRVGGWVAVFPEAPFELSVLNNAWVGSKVSGVVQIANDLYQTSGVVNGPSVSVGGTTHQQAVKVTEPCPCSGSKLIDIPSIVSSGVDKNDDASLGLDPDALADISADKAVAMPCGTYYFTGVHAKDGATLTLQVNSKVVLLVDGPFNAEEGSKIVANIAPEGELDVFVLGQFGEPYAQGVPTNNIVLGTKERAAAVRIYVWSPTADGTLTLGGTFIGNLYAPNVAMVAGDLEVYGSILGGLPNLNHVNVHYDRAILDAADHCEDGPTSCASCADCTAEQGCVGGTCGACTADSDCCPPLVCIGEGKCGALIK